MASPGEAADPNEPRLQSDTLDDSSGILDYSNDALSCAIEMLEAFPTPIQRLSETFEFVGDLLRGRVDLDIKLPERDKSSSPAYMMETLVLPVVVRDRDQTLHNLRVSSEQPLSVSLLSRDEADSIVALTIEGRLKRLFPQFHDSEMSGEPVELLKGLIAAAVSDAPHIEADMDSALEALRSKFKRPTAQQNVDLHELAEMCRQFCQGYFQFVEITGIFGLRVRIHYTFDIVHEENKRLDERSDNYPYVRIRRFFGLRPFRFTLPARNALRTNSYHFNMQAFEGFYLADASFQHPGAVAQRHGKDFYKSESILTVDGRKVTRSPLGSPFVHLHLPHGTKLPRNEQISVRVKFYEIPPGTLGVAVVLNLALFAILAVSLFLLNRLLVSESAGSDFPLLLLALPATCGLWLQLTGASIDRGRGSLSARLGIWGNGVLSGLAIILFIVGRTLLAGATSIGIAIPIAWLSLTACTFAAVAILSWLLRDAAKAYRRAGKVDMKSTEA